MDVFNSELEFERCLIDKLTKDCGWKGRILDHPTEKDILDNWAQILFQNNRGIDRLNDHPLTEGEMAQIIDQIKKLKTPLRLNGFINGRTVSIIRDNPDDIEHFGKEISLKIYDRKEIAGGDSLYQIAEQPIFATQSGMISDRRGDVMLLINGMPVIHIELKRRLFSKTLFPLLRRKVQVHMICDTDRIQPAFHRGIQHAPHRRLAVSRKLRMHMGIAQNSPCRPLFYSIHRIVPPPSTYSPS